MPSSSPPAREGAADAAQVRLRQRVAHDPNDLGATIALALALLRDGRLAEAGHHARNAVRIAPDNPQSHNLMGMILTEAGQPHAGEHHYRRVLDLAATRDPILLANLAWNLALQGRMEEARRLYEESTRLAPNVAQTLLGRARLEEADRQFDAACAVLGRAERAFPDDPRFLLARAVTLDRLQRPGLALALLERIAGLRGGGLDGSEHLLRGRLLDRLGRYDEAFAAFTEGKRRLREAGGQGYDAEAARTLADRLAGFFTAGRLRLLPRAMVPAVPPRPIFILGFPRSGTTLIEQTLSAHPLVAAGDELPFIADIAAVLPRLFDSPLGYPEALAELWMADHRDGLDELRDRYLRALHRRGVVRPGVRWITDKMPLNEMHLGLIALMFPASPLIHVLRHPLDAVLSVYAQHLTHGFGCGFALDAAARHYVLVMDLVAHYRREMALRYLPVRYEDVVENQVATVRRLLDFIGLPFDPACLHFHENRRHARTASYAQVAEPLHARSRFRYRHYLRHLEPVIPILQPVIDRLGYAIDPQAPP